MMLVLLLLSLAPILTHGIFSLRGFFHFSHHSCPPAIRWSFNPGTPFSSSSPALSNDGQTIYLGACNAVYAISNDDGSVNWHYDPNKEGNTTETVKFGSPGISLSDNGTIFVGADNNLTYALNTEDGSLRWTFKCGGPVVAAPSTSKDGDVVYVTSFDTALHALNATDGKELWNFTTRNRIYSRALPHEDSIYLTSTDHALYRIDASDGSLIWRWTTVGYNTTGGDVFASPVLSNDGTRVYLGSDDYNMTAIDTKSGEVVWNFTTESFIRSTAIVDPEDNIYFGSFDRHFYAVNKEGEELWKYYMGYAVASSPALGLNDTVYIGGNDSVVYAFNTSTGDQLWNLTLGGGIESQLLVNCYDDTLYVVSDDGALTAIGGPQAVDPQEAGTGSGNEANRKAILIGTAIAVPLGVALLGMGSALYSRLRWFNRNPQAERLIA